MRIALTGPMRSGKDEVAAYLTEAYGFQRLAFGDGIRRVCEQLYPEQFILQGKPRYLLQSFGQFARQHDPDVWVNQVMTELFHREYYAGHPLDVVITDLRQPNEYERLRAEGFAVIRILASEPVRMERMQECGDVVSEGALFHETETHYPHFAVDAEIHNEGTREELRQAVDCVLEYLRRRTNGSR